MNLLWLVILFPLVGAALNGLVLRNASKNVSHIVGSAAMLASFLCALVLYSGFMSSGGQATVYEGFRWLEAGNFSAPFHFILDRLSGMMMLVVTGIGSLIHIYAGGYMHEEKKTYRFFSYLNLFVFMMLLLVMGDNLLIMFIGWEGVGLCSYLLIGYWFEEEENAAAGMKAFLVNRIGDIGFLIGIFLTYQYFGTVSFTELRSLVEGGEVLTAIHLTAIGWITLSLFVGACGKSAQIPLYVWLPDAMAGPTPVSALIHAATMVTAGVYMMTRLNFFYYLAPGTMAVVAAVGAATALFAATIALVQSDIKKVLAYSTVSQLGYMVLACGVGAFDAGVFHLFTHACFKALLFLGAGSVIVAMHHKQDMFEMGGLKKCMPITHIVMLIGVLAITGVPGLAGFFSKDEILWKAWIGGGPVIWGMASLAAVCTSFYMFRLYFLTFQGSNRSDKKTQEHLHETPAHMWGPLCVLAFLSVVVGYLNVPEILPIPGIPSFAFNNYLEPVIFIPDLPIATQTWAFLKGPHNHALEYALMGISVAGAGVGFFMAFNMYKNGPSEASAAMKQRFQNLHETLENKYWVDEFYFNYIVEPVKEMSMFLWKIIDTAVVDGIVNGIGQAFRLVGGVLSFRMSGSLHRHGMVLIVGLVCMLTVFMF